MYLDVEQVCWMDGHFNIYTTLMVCGYFYTFVGEMAMEEMDRVLSTIMDNLEDAEADGATLEMDKSITKMVYKNVHQTNLIIN